MYNEFKYCNKTTFTDILKHLQNSFATINNNLYEYKKLSYLLHKDEKSNINIFLHNLLYKYWNIFNFTSLSIATILSFLLKLLYKKAEKYTKSKLPPKFQEIIFTNLFNKINLTKNLLNKIKNIINNIKNKIIIYKTKLANKQPKDKQRVIKIELDINIDFIKNITKNITKITKEIINITLSFINISSTTKETQIKTKPIKDLAILFVGKPKLSNKETSNKENETTTENQKICQKFPTKEKPTINFKPIILNEREEKIEKMKKENFENNNVLKILEKSVSEIDFYFINNKELLEKKYTTTSNTKRKIINKYHVNEFNKYNKLTTEKHNAITQHSKIIKDIIYQHNVETEQNNFYINKNKYLDLYYK